MSIPNTYSRNGEFSIGFRLILSVYFIQKVYLYNEAIDFVINTLTIRNIILSQPFPKISAIDWHRKLTWCEFSSGWGWISAINKIAKKQNGDGRTVGGNKVKNHLAWSPHRACSPLVDIDITVHIFFIILNAEKFHVRFVYWWRYLWNASHRKPALQLCSY